MFRPISSGLHGRLVAPWQDLENGQFLEMTQSLCRLPCYGALLSRSSHGVWIEIPGSLQEIP